MKGRDELSKHSVHKEAFQSLKMYIDDTLIKNEGAEFLTSIHKQYLTLLGDTDSSYPSQSLLDKIQKEYPITLKRHKMSNKAGVIIFNSKLRGKGCQKSMC